MDAFGIVSLAGLAAVCLVAAGAVSDIRRHLGRPRVPHRPLTSRHHRRS